jgi:hypothetical protein
MKKEALENANGHIQKTSDEKRHPTNTKVLLQTATIQK